MWPTCTARTWSWRLGSGKWSKKRLVALVLFLVLAPALALALALALVWLWFLYNLSFITISPQNYQLKAGFHIWCLPLLNPLIIQSQRLFCLLCYLFWHIPLCVWHLGSWIIAFGVVLAQNSLSHHQVISFSTPPYQERLVAEMARREVNSQVNSKVVY